MKKIIAVFFMFLFSFILTACEIEQLDQKFNVVFEVNGEVYETREVFYLERVSLPDNPELEGMEFEYWMHNGEAFDINTRITINLHLVASFKDINDIVDPIDPVDPVDPIVPDVTKYSVFVYDGDKLLAEIIVESGKTVNLSSVNTSKDGYIFSGWFNDANLNTPFDTNTKITKDTHIFAKFEEYVPGDYLAYYSGIEGLSGTALKSALNRIISKSKATSYDTVKKVLVKSDIKTGTSNRLYLIYDSKETHNVWDSAKTWNREHVWPDSKLSGAPKGESHNLRASDVSTNGNRGNLAFADGTGQYGKRVSGGYFPGDEHKGDVARIIMFMVVKYSQLNFGSSIGNLDMFLRWHQEDPVNEFERNRNDVIQDFQGDRNPFIDHPEIANLIWGGAKLSSNQDIALISQSQYVFDMQTSAQI